MLPIWNSKYAANSAHNADVAACILACRKAGLPSPADKAVA
jgi:hypothetical protein